MLGAALLAASLAAGSAAAGSVPPLALTASDGRRVTLESHRGSPVLVVFYRGHW